MVIWCNVNVLAVLVPFNILKGIPIARAISPIPNSSVLLSRLLSRREAQGSGEEVFGPIRAVISEDPPLSSRDSLNGVDPLFVGGLLSSEDDDNTIRNLAMSQITYLAMIMAPTNEMQQFLRELDSDRAGSAQRGKGRRNDLSLHSALHFIHEQCGNQWGGNSYLM
ncbi:hypothetical protein M758_UG057700 [Ceratodon purpureus]|nr:hypothetical protein M758_UG057700 [Ceratodon purpureus]